MAKYETINVKLVGEDGNAMAIMSRVGAALRKAGVEQSEIDTYYEESMSGDYDNVLRTAMKWVSVS